MSGGARLTDTDHGYAALRKRIEEAKLARVTVGIHDDVADQPHPSGSGATIGEVAGWLEHGTSKVDRRSWLGDWFDENVDPNRALLRKLAEGIVTGAITSGRQAMEAFGIKAKFGIVTRWATGLPPENAASTIKAKGSSTPGIDSGETRKAVDYKVYDR